MFQACFRLRGGSPGRFMFLDGAGVKRFPRKSGFLRGRFLPAAAPPAGLIYIKGSGPHSRCSDEFFPLSTKGLPFESSNPFYCNGLEDFSLEFSLRCLPDVYHLNFFALILPFYCGFSLYRVRISPCKGRCTILLCRKKLEFLPKYLEF